MNRRTVIIVGTTALIAVLGDIFTYSLGASKGGKFRIAVPKGKDIVPFLALGVASGLVVNQVVKQVEKGVKSKEEIALDKLVERESARVIRGELDENLVPTEIVWVGEAEERT